MNKCCSGTPFDQDPPCEVCSMTPDGGCTCQPCGVCGEIGNPECYDTEGHGMMGPPQWELVRDVIVHDGPEDLVW